MGRFAFLVREVRPVDVRDWGGFGVFFRMDRGDGLVTVVGLGFGPIDF